jgi:hypothetical protein
MRFVVEHEFEVSVEELAAATLDRTYAGYLAAHHPLLLAAEEQSRAEHDGVLMRRVHVTPKPAFEHIGHKKLAPEWFEFVDESTWNASEHRLAFAHLPTEERVRRRLNTRGAVSLARVSERRTRRTTEISIDVHDLPFVLRPFKAVAEQMLAREARKMVELEADVMQRFLKERTGVSTESSQTAL